MKNKQISLRLDRDTHELLKEMAWRRRLSLNEYCFRALRGYALQERDFWQSGSDEATC